LAVSIARIASSTWRARLRGQLLSVAASAQSLVALAALLDPDRVANAMGLFPVGVNGYSQFYALYVGVRLATAGLALLAARQGDQPILGDLAALFVVSGIELAVGLALIGLRPQGRFLSLRPSP
jgi:ABC-type transport system involved in cytochrome c biogenesis permease subunit